MAQRRQQAPASPDVPGVEPVEEVIESPDLDDDDDDDDGAFDEPAAPQGRTPQPYANGEVTNTSNFFGGSPDPNQRPVNLVQDRGVEVAEEQPTSNIVRVTEDVGPIFLGRRRKIELKKGVAYKVDDDVYDYLADRQLIYGA